MRHILAATVAVFTLALGPVAQAQTVAGANSGSSSGATAGSQAGAVVNQTWNSDGTLTHKGTQTLRTAPDAIAPSLGSGHPCMVNTSVGLSIIGGGVSGGSGKVDVGCMMMRSNNPTDNMAGRYYYAAKDKTACVSWRNVGALPADYPCTDADRRAKRVRTPARAVVTYTLAKDVSCEIRNGKWVSVVKSQDVLDTLGEASIKKYCRAKRPK